MYIFYDFETSTRELLGQILSYSFIVADSNLNVINELNGLIRLNRMQVPEFGAIQTNKLNISILQEKGDTEFQAAQTIHNFLDHCVQTHGICTLVGFNSNQFDLNFLRNTLIRYGINPYFKGKLQNLDILHFIQYIAFKYPSKFPWIRVTGENHSYYSFKLEDICSELGLLNEAQSHDAREDVLLTIRLVKIIERFFQESLKEFEPIFFPKSEFFQGSYEIVKQKTRHFSETEEALSHYKYNYWLKLADIKKAKLMINLSKLDTLIKSNESNISNEDKLSTLKYINPNKHFFQCEPITAEDAQYLTKLEIYITEDTFFQNIQQSPNNYFSLIEKPWDIDYQIHELGFERIDILAQYIDKLHKKPEAYSQLLKNLLENRSCKKDTYLIQLFNRFYLNYHPSPNPEHCLKYIKPRYIEGSMLRDQKGFTPLTEQISWLENHLESGEYKLEDEEILIALMEYYNQFKQNYLSLTI